MHDPYAQQCCLGNGLAICCQPSSCTSCDADQPQCMIAANARNSAGSAYMLDSLTHRVPAPAPVWRMSYARAPAARGHACAFGENLERHHIGHNPKCQKLVTRTHAGSSERKINLCNHPTVAHALVAGRPAYPSRSHLLSPACRCLATSRPRAGRADEV